MFTIPSNPKKSESLPSESTSISIRSSEIDTTNELDFISDSRDIRNRIAFFFIGVCSLSLQSFVNVIANKALGAGKHTAVVMLALYLPQVVLRIYTDYWTKALHYHYRFLLTVLMGVTSLSLLYIFMDASSTNSDTSLWYLERICVLMSITLIGLSTTVAEVSAYGYCTYFDKQCTNFMSSGGGFGALLGASISFIQNELKFTNQAIIIGCFLFPMGLTVSYALGLTHTTAHQNKLRESRVQSQSATGETIQNTHKTMDIQCTTPSPKCTDDDCTLIDLRAKRIGAQMTIKLLVVDLINYTFPLFAVYFLYNVVLAGFIAPSYDVLDPHQQVTIDRYKSVYQYFVFSLRIGVFLGKSSGFLHIKKFFVFPAFFVIGCVFGGFLAYAPVLMKWFILEKGGHWTLWVLGLPLGWTYGATSASVLFGIRTDCPNKLKEFALSNVTFASAFGQSTGNVAAIFISATVYQRYGKM